MLYKVILLGQIRWTLGRIDIAVWQCAGSLECTPADQQTKVHDQMPIPFDSTNFGITFKVAASPLFANSLIHSLSEIASHGVIYLGIGSPWNLGRKLSLEH